MKGSDNDDSVDDDATDVTPTITMTPTNDANNSNDDDDNNNDDDDAAAVAYGDDDA